MSQRSEDAISSRSEEHFSDSSSYEKGQRLACAQCQSEIEIISPCTCDPPDQVLRCCGEPMRPTTGVGVNINVEG